MPYWFRIWCQTFWWPFQPRKWPKNGQKWQNNYPKSGKLSRNDYKTWSFSLKNGFNHISGCHTGSGFGAKYFGGHFSPKNGQKMAKSGQNNSLNRANCQEMTTKHEVFSSKMVSTTFLDVTLEQDGVPHIFVAISAPKMAKKWPKVAKKLPRIGQIVKKWLQNMRFFLQIWCQPHFWMPHWSRKGCHTFWWPCQHQKWPKVSKNDPKLGKLSRDYIRWVFSSKMVSSTFWTGPGWGAKLSGGQGIVPKCFSGHLM